MSMHIASLVKIPCYLHVIVRKLKCGRVSGRNLPISNPKPDLHTINAHTKFGENPLMFTQVINWKRKMDRQTDGRTHGRPT